MQGGGKKKRERMRLHATGVVNALLAEADGLPDVNFDRLTEQIMDRLTAEAAVQQRESRAVIYRQQQFQIGADPSRNVGGQTWPDVVEDGAPIMLDNIPA
jgi:hypothetical protein